MAAAGLDHLPLEVLEVIIWHSPPRSIAHLHCTSSRLRRQTNQCLKAWRRLCCHLDIEDWASAAEGYDAWRMAYLRHVALRRSLARSSPLEARRFLHDLLNGATPMPSLRMRSDTPFMCPSAYTPAFNELFTQYAVLPTRRASSMVTRSAVAFAHDSKHTLVTAQSEQGSKQSMVTAWRLAVEHESSQEPFFERCLPYELPYQHLHVTGDLFLCIPFKNRDRTNVLIEAFDLTKPTSEPVAQLRHFQPVVRGTPEVYKESGAPRIYTYTNRVLFVDGIPEWNIFIADLPSAGATEFILRHQLELPRVNRNLVDPFFASDQTGSSVALAFFVVENSFSEASSAILLCDILTGGYRVVSPWEVSPLLGKFDVSAGIEEMRCYIMTATGKTYSQRGLIENNKDDLLVCPNSFRVFVTYPGDEGSVNDKDEVVATLPEIALLTAECSLLMLGSRERAAGCPLSDEASTLDWYMNEFVVMEQEEVVVVLRKTSNLGRVLYAVSLQDLDRLLWRVDVDQSHKVLDLNVAHRFFLSFGLGYVWLADPAGVTFLKTTSGSFSGRLKFPRLRRALREIPPSEPNVSAYAQTGCSVWGVAKLGGCGGGEARLLVVHDIERSAPIAFDVIKLG